MAQYRKKPVVINAIQLTWEAWNDVCDFFQTSERKQSFTIMSGCYVDEKGKATTSVTNEIGCEIHTDEGVMLARQFDWIIKGVNGEFYPCKPDVFEKTYESV